MSPSFTRKTGNMSQAKPPKVEAGEPIRLGLNFPPVASQVPLFIAILRSFCVKANQPLQMARPNLLEHLVDSTTDDAREKRWAIGALTTLRERTKQA